MIDLQASAKQHLWLHFARMGAYQSADAEIPVFVRGDGVHLYDEHGKEYLDGLSGLFTVQIGHGRAALGEAGARQAAKLAYYPIWSAAHPAAIELAELLTDLSPGHLNRVFFTSGGSEAVESAWKLARCYFQAIGRPGKTKVIARDLAYHGTTMGALSITGLPAIKEPFEPLVPGTIHVTNTNRFRSTVPSGQFTEEQSTEEQFSKACADAIEAAIVAAGPETVAAVFLEPVQNTGGCFVPPRGYFQRVREICDRHDVLLVSDEVICAFGRLGSFFCDADGVGADMITFAKGVTSGYAPLGGVLVHDRIAEPFLRGNTSFGHGLTFGGHPVSCAVAMANLDVFENEHILDHVNANAQLFRKHVESLRDLPIVGDVRGDGYFLAIELVKDPTDLSARFTEAERQQLVRGTIAPALFERGLICRADDRVDPIIQLAPVLTSGPDEFAQIEATIREVLTLPMSW